MGMRLTLVPCCQLVSLYLVSFDIVHGDYFNRMNDRTTLSRCIYQARFITLLIMDENVGHAHDAAYTMH